MEGANAAGEDWSDEVLRVADMMGLEPLLEHIQRDPYTLLDALHGEKVAVYNAGKSSLTLTMLAPDL